MALLFAFHVTPSVVVVNDAQFYISTHFEKKFDSVYKFAKSFHHERA